MYQKETGDNREIIAEQLSQETIANSREPYFQPQDVRIKWWEGLAEREVLNDVISEMESQLSAINQTLADEAKGTQERENTHLENVFAVATSVDGLAMLEEDEGIQFFCEVKNERGEAVKTPLLDILKNDPKSAPLLQEQAAINWQSKDGREITDGIRTKIEKLSEVKMSVVAKMGEHMLKRIEGRTFMQDNPWLKIPLRVGVCALLAGIALRNDMVDHAWEQQGRTLGKREV